MLEIALLLCPNMYIDPAWFRHTNKKLCSKKRQTESLQGFESVALKRSSFYCLSIIHAEFDHDKICAD